MTMDCSFLGKHVLAEFEGVRPAWLNDEPFLRTTLLDALAESGATVLDITGRQFHPQGVTVLALLSESHASIHTYPEHRSMFVDVFTCGSHTKPDMAVRRLMQLLSPDEAYTTVIRRGEGAPSLKPKESKWIRSTNPLLPGSPAAGSSAEFATREPRPFSVS